MSASPFPARELREYADALDTDRGHSKSRVTLLMREAADRIMEAETVLREVADGFDAFHQSDNRLDGLGELLNRERFVRAALLRRDV